MLFAGNMENQMPDVISNSTSGFSVENAYNSIRGKILSSELRAGSWLREGDLATELGISRTPVREALRRLMAEGLVEHHRNRGVRVQSWTPEDLAQSYWIRSLLEPAACALAASKDIVNLRELDLMTDEMELATKQDPVEIENLTKLNNLFHQTIIRASGNSQLQTLVELTIQVPIVQRNFALYSPVDLRRSVEHHREIIDAIRAKNPDWAEAIMRAHLQSGRDHVLH